MAYLYLIVLKYPIITVSLRMKRNVVNQPTTQNRSTSEPKRGRKMVSPTQTRAIL